MSATKVKSENPIKILLVNEIPLMGNVISAALEDEPDIHVVSSVTNIDEALKIVEENAVDVRACQHPASRSGRA